MLSHHILPYSKYYQLEMQQSRDEGKDVSDFRDLVNTVDGCAEGPEKEAAAAACMDNLQSRPLKLDFHYYEPFSLDEVFTERAEFRLPDLPLHPGSFSEEIVYDKIYGAWLGRCAGCLLGQPVEFWPRERIYGLLRNTNNLPVHYYISSDLNSEIRNQYNISDIGWSYGSDVVNWINNVQYMPEDDDINYVVIALKILERYGHHFISHSVAEQWLTDLPVLHVFCGERIAYKNILNGIFPPESGRYKNPFRESLGAQIRGDFYGYINPGKPEAAAEMAWKDASVSHDKNGIYGEMFVSAMLAAAAVSDDVNDVILCGLSQIPRNSRLAEAVRKIMGWMKSGTGLEQIIDRIHERYDEADPYEQLHVIPNAMIVCVGLLYGDMDFEKSIGAALLGSFDKDCNCATVGSIMGMMLGAKALPEKWINPLNDRLKSGVDGFGVVRISDLARRTAAMVCRA
jgi:ADP-ribosylglycohydrolase